MSTIKIVFLIFTTHNSKTLNNLLRTVQKMTSTKKQNVLPTSQASFSFPFFALNFFFLSTAIKKTIIFQFILAIHKLKLVTL